jgi:hypothetical protein
MAFMVRLDPVTPIREIFILAGESNMSGRGVVADLPDFPYAYKVKNYKNSGVWADGAEPIDDPTGQVDSVSNDSTSAKASPGMAFGNKLAILRPYNEVGLVPCAKGSTTIANWAKSGLSRTTLYGSMVARANEAKAAGQLKGVFWWQGWNDAENSTAAANIGTNLLSMFTSLRTDVAEPNLKFVVVGLQTSNTATYRNTINTNLAALDGGLSGAIKYVAPGAISVISGDEVHASAAGQVVVGELGAAAMHTLLG